MPNTPLTSAHVGMRVRLLPDHNVKLRHNDYRFNPNSSLGIPIGEWRAITEIAVSERVVIIKVEGSDRMVDMRRFTNQIAMRRSAKAKAAMAA